MFYLPTAIISIMEVLLVVVPVLLSVAYVTVAVAYINVAFTFLYKLTGINYALNVKLLGLYDIISLVTSFIFVYIFYIGFNSCIGLNRCDLLLFVISVITLTIFGYICNKYSSYQKKTNLTFKSFYLVN